MYRLSLYFKSRIAVPKGVSFQDALTVAQCRTQWLAKHLARMVLIEQAVAARKKENDLTSAQARDILVRRLESLADRHGFTFNRIFVRNQRTRWGSCSRKNNINLNIKLVQLPAALMDYIILHELVHTRVKNHGPAFWKELSRHMSNPKQLDRQLNAYWILLVDDPR